MMKVCCNIKNSPLWMIVMSEERSSEQFSEAEVRQVIRLLATALAPDDGRAAKVARLMHGLCEWIGGDGWFWVRSRIDPETLKVNNYDFLYGGEMGQTQLVLWGDRSLNPVEHDADEFLVLRERAAKVGGDMTVTLDEMVPPEIWSKPSNQAFVRKMGFDQSLYSVRQLRGVDGMMFSFLMISRRTGKPVFDPHVASLVHMVMQEVGPLHSDGLNLDVGEGVASLTPRQRIVLTCLIDGQSTKTAAANLGLSANTVKDHAKAIYRIFGVHSRPELMNRFLSGGRK